MEVEYYSQQQQVRLRVEGTVLARFGEFLGIVWDKRDSIIQSTFRLSFAEDLVVGAPMWSFVLILKQAFDSRLHVDAQGRIFVEIRYIHHPCVPLLSLYARCLLETEGQLGG